MTINFDFGDLTKRIDIFSRIITKDSIGGEQVTNVLFKQVWAKVLELDERPNYSQKVSKDQQKCIFYLRFQVGFEPHMLIVKDAISYEIYSIINVNDADKWLKITAHRLMS